MEEKNFSGKFYPLQCDLLEPNDILNSFKWIDENIGAIHFMINNAGITRIKTVMGKNILKFKYFKLKFISRTYRRYLCIAIKN